MGNESSNRDLDFSYPFSKPKSWVVTYYSKDALSPSVMPI